MKLIIDVEPVSKGKPVIFNGKLIVSNVNSVSYKRRFFISPNVYKETGCLAEWISIHNLIDALLPYEHPNFVEVCNKTKDSIACL